MYSKIQRANSLTSFSFTQILRTRPDKGSVNLFLFFHPTCYIAATFVTLEGMMTQSIEQTQTIVLKEYKIFLKDIKDRILSSQLKAALAVNRELINLYWEIGSRIHLKQKSEGWGAKTIENLSNDLKTSFPNMEGFSSRNLKYMVHFAREYPDFAIGQQVVAQIPWGQNILLLQKLKSPDERLWYANKTIENGWSRNVLLHWLDSNLHHREGKSITNFQATLPSPQSDLAHQTLKDPYCFDFLALKENLMRRNLKVASWSIRKNFSLNLELVLLL